MLSKHEELENQVLTALVEKLAEEGLPPHERNRVFQKCCAIMSLYNKFRADLEDFSFTEVEEFNTLAEELSIDARLEIAETRKTSLLKSIFRDSRVIYSNWSGR